MMDKTARSKLLDEVGVWIRSIRNFPGFMEWKQQSIQTVLDYRDPIFGERHDNESQGNFVFPPHMEKQHNAVMSYLSLDTTYQAIADSQYYFRRYPFSNLPVSHDRHLRYICEMYFSRIYEFSERLKRCLNVLNEVIPQRIDAGAFIKLYAKEFRSELKERNKIHHHNHFNDMMIDKIWLLGAMTFGDDKENIDRGWRSEQKAAYREACKEWSERAKCRSDRVADYVNAVAQVMLNQCHFLKEPIRERPADSATAALRDKLKS